MFQSSSLGGWATGNGPPVGEPSIPTVTRSNFAEQSLLHHVDRTQEAIAIAPLLRADEKHKLGISVARIADQLVFFQRERQRLLAKNVLARLQGFDRDLDVPVVRRDDAHHVDILAVQHLAVIAVQVGFAFADLGIVLGLLGVAPIDVAHGHDVAEVAVLLGVTGAHAAEADAANPRTIVFRYVGQHLPSPGYEWRRRDRAPALIN